MSPQTKAFYNYLTEKNITKDDIIFEIPNDCNFIIDGEDGNYENIFVSSSPITSPVFRSNGFYRQNYNASELIKEQNDIEL